MTYDPTKHNRRSIRKKGYDYTQAGAYFVTVCTQNRKPILTDPIISGIMSDVWLALPQWFPTIGLDEFVIMPNHGHFVTWLQVDPEELQVNECKLNADVPLEPNGLIQVYEHDANQVLYNSLPRDWVIPTPQVTNERPHLGDVVSAWKSLTATVYLNWIRTHGLDRRAKFWQRNYYERIIRNDRALTAIRGYIRNNPKNWMLDPDNPANRMSLPFPETVMDYLDDVRRFL